MVFLHSMHKIYNLLIHLSSFGLRIAALFNKKMNLFVAGRKDVFKILEQNIKENDKTIWFHCASLGEFEQGVPVIEEVKKLKSNHKIVVSFFSSSGYEIKKNTPLADVVVYLPLDTPQNAKKFLELIHPSLSIFVKYEFWPNYLLELKNRNIPILLVSGVFRENQIFFKPYGGFMRKALKSIDHFFLQEKNSVKLLNSIGFKNTTLSGDTRFDRVSHQIETDNTLRFAKEFKDNSICIVCGSTWPEDEAVLLNYINSTPQNVKFIIAPHQMDSNKIAAFTEKIITQKVVLHSQKDEVNLAEYSVLIIDCIGLLTKLYSYADIAYVGGAMGNTGLHNILEPATFGVPIVIGKNYDNFPEASQLRQLAGLFTVSNSLECANILDKLVIDNNFRRSTGMIAEHFVNHNTGASKKIMDFIKSNYN